MLHDLTRRLSLCTLSLLAVAACSAGDGGGADMPVAPVELVSEAPAQPVLPEFTFTPEQQAFFDVAGWSGFDPSQLKVQKLKDGLAVIFGYGGNILVSTGADGTLIVDNQFPQIHEAILELIREMGGDGVDYVINTHWHFDHAEGNRAFGPLGAEIIAHENSRQYMSRATDVNLVQIVYPQQSYEPAAIPAISYTTTMNMALNGDLIGLYNFGPAHTTGDTFVYLKTSNVIHLGDVANLTGTVFIDADNGGSIDGMITSLREALKLIDDETIVVPGHGDVADKATIETYVSSLETVRARIAGMMAEGKTLEEIQAAAPAEDLFGPTGPMLVDRAYVSMQ